MECSNIPFFFFSVPRPLALVLDFALALGMVLLVTFEVALGLIGLVVDCAGFVLAMVEDGSRTSRGVGGRWRS